MTPNSELGQLGENIACGYLVKNKYKIIERNFQRPFGEIDIIAKSPDKTLVFVEVKTMKRASEEGLRPENQLSTAKLNKIKRTASLYANSHLNLINDNKGWRIDLLALTICGKSVDIKHFPHCS